MGAVLLAATLGALLRAPGDRFDGMPQHLRDAIRRGGAAHWQGKVITLKEAPELAYPGSPPAPGGESADADLEREREAHAKTQGELASLRSQVETLEDFVDAEDVCEGETPIDAIRRQLVEHFEDMRAVARAVRTMVERLRVQVSAEDGVEAAAQKIVDEVDRRLAAPAQTTDAATVDGLLQVLAPPDPKVLDRFAVDQLACLARHRGIQVPDGATKGALIGLLAPTPAEGG